MSVTMYDTINLWLPPEEMGHINIIVILQSLSEVYEHYKPDGQAYYSGFLNNYKVSLSEQGVSLKGSLAKYFLLDNFHTLTRSDTGRAVEQLSDNLHLPMGKARITRLDFAQNLLMEYKPEAYYYHLGDSMYYNRLPQEKSLYYTNGMRQKVFYDKLEQNRLERNILPEVWNGKNILRYELRYKSRLPRQFKKEKVTASFLPTEKFYIDLFDKWFNEYEAITKLNNINFDLSEMKSPKDFFKQLSLMAINAIGQDNIMQEVENLRSKNAFDKPEYYSRLKRDIRELCKASGHTSSSGLVEELDRKIKQTKKHYR